MFPRHVDHHGERCAVPERISCAEVTYNINLDNEKLFQGLDDIKCP